MNFDKGSTSEEFLSGLLTWNNLYSPIWEVGVLLLFSVWLLVRRRARVSSWN